MGGICPMTLHLVLYKEGVMPQRSYVSTLFQEEKNYIHNHVSLPNYALKSTIIRDGKHTHHMPTAKRTNKPNQSLPPTSRVNHKSINKASFLSSLLTTPFPKCKE